MTDAVTPPQAGRNLPAQAPLPPATRRVLANLIVVALLIPAAFNIAGVRFTPALVVLIFLFPVLVSRYASGDVKWRLPDLFFFLYVAWQGITIAMNNPERVVSFTGQQALLTLTGFLAGRLLILNKEDFYSLIRFVAAAAMISMPFALYESVFDDPIILRFIRDFTPFNTFAPNNYAPRLGLYRAQFTFTHPIHYGLLSALILMPYFLALKDQIVQSKRSLGALVIMAACFFSVSSGAVLSITFQFLVLLWYRVSERASKKPWLVVMITGGICYAILEVASDRSAFTALSTRLAFNSSTAFYRTLIWEYGSQQVALTPIFGNGFNNWVRPFWMVNSSVDNHWLLMAMVHGIPAVALFGSSILYAFIMVNRSQAKGDDPVMDRVRLAWTLSLVGFCMSASTVAIWGEIQLLFMLLFGGGFWMIDYIDENAEASAKADQERTMPFARYQPAAVRGRPVGQRVIPVTRDHSEPEITSRDLSGEGATARNLSAEGSRTIRDVQSVTQRNTLVRPEDAELPSKPTSRFASKPPRNGASRPGAVPPASRPKPGAQGAVERPSDGRSAEPDAPKPRFTRGRDL